MRIQHNDSSRRQKYVVLIVAGLRRALDGGEAWLFKRPQLRRCLLPLRRRPRAFQRRCRLVGRPTHARPMDVVD